MATSRLYPAISDMGFEWMEAGRTCSGCRGDPSERLARHAGATSRALPLNQFNHAGTALVTATKRTTPGP